jgi:hypothetical protein
MTCKHLLPVVVSICFKYPSLASAHGLIFLCNQFGATFDAEKTKRLIIFRIATFSQSKDMKISERLGPILSSKVAEPDDEEVKKLVFAALENLDHPPFPLQMPGDGADA